MWYHTNVLFSSYFSHWNGNYFWFNKHLLVSSDGFYITGGLCFSGKAQNILNTLTSFYGFE